MKIKQRHKWKKSTSKPVKDQIDDKTCTKCGIQARRVRKGSSEPRKGWIDTSYRRGPLEYWQSCRGSGVPDCKPVPVCMTCNGTGRYPDEEKYRHMPYVSCCPDSDCVICSTPE